MNGRLSAEYIDITVRTKIHSVVDSWDLPTWQRYSLRIDDSTGLPLHVATNAPSTKKYTHNDHDGGSGNSNSRYPSGSGQQNQTTALPFYQQHTVATLLNETTPTLRCHHRWWGRRGLRPRTIAPRRQY